MRLVRKFGEMWAKNLENIEKIPGSKQGGQGVYILYDGSLPVYVGKGNIRSRVRGARRSRTRGEFWDRFSWYVIKNKQVTHDTEALILRMLPPCLRSLTRQSGHFLHAHPEPEAKHEAEFILRKTHKKKKS
jgi:hypothetical protein